jgi:hypothetical protein
MLFTLIPISARSPVDPIMAVMRIAPIAAKISKVPTDLILTSRLPALTNETNLRRLPQKLFVGIVCTLLLGLGQPSARAADALDIRLPPVAQLDPPAAPIDPASPSAQTSTGGFIGTLDSIIASLDAYAASARATQPNWSTPLTTTTGLLERRLRFDFSQQHSGNGTNTSVIDGNKSLELIVNDTTEIQVGPPPYYVRSRSRHRPNQ